jgi:excisionase family DNA binding protein
MLGGEPDQDEPADVDRALPLLLNAVETGRLLSISRAKVLDLAARGSLPSIRVGGSVRIPRDRLISWMDGHFSEIDGMAPINSRPSRGLRGQPD